jgi:flagellar biosynthesis/type III secretory pathway protein FliH
MELEQMVQAEVRRIRYEGLKDGRVEGLRDGLKDGRVEGLRDGLKDGRVEGLKDGRVEGLKDGRVEGLRQTITDLCEICGIELTSERTARIESLDRSALEALRLVIKSQRTWPS